MELLGRKIGGTEPLFFLIGPCVIETLDHALYCADKIAGIAERTGCLIVYKSSFDKANRTSVSSYRGPGLHDGLEILHRVRRETGLPVITDVHDPAQVHAAALICDVLQTPAFLARQTDLITAAASSGRPVNFKKAQFMAPQEMERLAEKAVQASKGQTIMLCERGTSFGYNNLVVDMRGLAIMAAMGLPVVFDATHSVQLPGANGTSSGGQREFVPLLARSAVAAGVSGVFMETHQDPDNAPCDGPNAWPLDQLEELVRRLCAIHEACNEKAL